MNRFIAIFTCLIFLNILGCGNNQNNHKDAEEIYNADGARADSFGISGSPTFVINGVKVQVNRSPEAIKTAICNAFTTTPAECNQTLLTQSPTPSFGSGTSATVSNNAGCVI